MKRWLLMMSAVCMVATAAAQAEPARILVFGDSNSWGWQATPDGFPAVRHADDVRWAGVLDAALSDAIVVVDGLIGRRTDLAGQGDIALVAANDFNGASALPEAIARHMPLDLVVIMLGTNDLQVGVGRSPDEVAAAAFGLAALVQGSDNPVFSAYAAPEVLIVAPPPLSDTTATPLSGLFQEGVAASAKLGGAFAAEAERSGIPFFDAGAVTATDGVDGIHLTAANHAALGTALAPVIQQLLLN